MARLLGIDIRDTHVRVALLRTRYRTVSLEQLAEVQVTGGIEAALTEALKPMLHLGEHLAVAIDGQRSFVHTLKIPSTAMRQLADVLPFELEAELPIDIEEVVYDYRVPKRVASGGVAEVLTAAARETDVRAAIQLVKGVTRREPERVSLGALPLANLAALAPAALATRPVALIDFGGAHTDFVVLEQGRVVFARTLSQGVGVLPAGAESLAAELRQSLTAWLAKGGQGVEAVYLTGSLAPGASEYLAYHLSSPVEALPPLNCVISDPALAAQVPRFGRAIGIALGLRSGAQDLNLRQAGGGFESSFGVLRERAPVLSGLLASILVFFLFSSWAELRTLERDHEALEGALGKLSLHVLGEETASPERVSELLDKGPGKQDTDPMPRFDAFDVIVEISKAVPHTVTHDIEDFDVQRNKVKINGVVGSTDEAQNIAAKLKEHSCLHDVKVSKFTQVVNSERQKYVLEFDALCPEDGGGKKPAAKADSAGGAQ